MYRHLELKSMLAVLNLQHAVVGGGGIGKQRGCVYLAGFRAQMVERSRSEHGVASESSYSTRKAAHAGDGGGHRPAGKAKLVDAVSSSVLLSTGKKIICNRVVNL
jgi:hypothetical protein